MINTGIELEKIVLEKVKKLVEDNEFLVSNPNVYVLEKPKYFSKDRNAEIEFDVSIEKYFENPKQHNNIRASLIIIIECKDYKKSISVDDVEEFHAKLEQVGADKTKGIMITKEATYQKSALMYAESKGITLARILPDNQVEYICYRMMPWEYERIKKEENCKINIEKALSSKKFYSKHGQNYYDTFGGENLADSIIKLLR